MIGNMLLESLIAKGTLVQSFVSYFGHWNNLIKRTILLFLQRNML